MFLPNGTHFCVFCAFCDYDTSFGYVTTTGLVRYLRSFPFAVMFTFSRYLCHTEPEYFDKLSAGSKKTLVFQGGPMSVNEKAIFDRDPMQAQCLALRRWDEGAKRPDWKVPGLDT